MDVIRPGGITRRDVGKLLAVSAAALSVLGLSTQKDDDLQKLYLGKQPARPEGVKLRLKDYITPSKLPTPPENFGRENLVKDWGMLGNDVAGDCAFAGPFHDIMLARAESNTPVNVNTQCTIDAYSTVTGYNPKAYDPFTRTNPTDQGADVQKVAEYWRTTGLKDADGKVHKIDAYLALEPRNTEQLFHALYLFGAVGIGIECPLEYQTAFFMGQAWDALKNPHIEGGHYILGVGRRAGMLNTVTWGRTQLMTTAGYEQFNDETLVYLNEERLTNGKSLDGFDLQTLIADMSYLANEREVLEPCPV